MISLSGIYLKIAHFPVKIGLIGGVWGGPRNSIFIGLLLFLLLRSPRKNSEPQLPPFLQKSKEERKKKKKNNGKYYSHYVCTAPLGPKSSVVNVYQSQIDCPPTGVLSCPWCNWFVWSDHSEVLVKSERGGGEQIWCIVTMQEQITNDITMF